MKLSAFAETCTQTCDQEKAEESALKSNGKLKTRSTLEQSEPPIWQESLSLDLLAASQLEIQDVLKNSLENSGLDLRLISLNTHRVVHGGEVLRSATFINHEILEQISRLKSLAPVHNPIAVKLIEAVKVVLPWSRQLAVFDTAFHSTIEERSYRYPLPRSWFDKFGIRRFGFHGINHAYCARKAEAMLKEANAGKKHSKIVICHLGNGCSLSAVENAVCLDTSMGFTPLEGLMMGTRSGSIDPGIIFHLLKTGAFSPSEIESALNNASGLLGLSALSKDMRIIEKSMSEGNKDAALAFEVFAMSLKKGIAAMSASLGGLDAVVFTAGIGENSSLLRRKVTEGLAYLGLALDQDANESCRKDAIISSKESKVTILRIEAREDLEMLGESRSLLHLAADKDLHLGKSQCKSSET